MSESGPFYGTFVDPLLQAMRNHIADEIQANKTTIDIACGTGAQVYTLSKTAFKVTGIDYSESMIAYAKKMCKKRNVLNVDFTLADATNLSMFKDGEFDFATLSLALHQFDPLLYKSILSEMKRVANKLIIVDYAFPLPQNYAGFGSKVAEFIAGKEHNRNFKHYCRLGGLNKILPQNQLEIIKSKFIGKGAFQIIVCESV